MRLHRFFIDNLIDGSKITVADERFIHQWRNVFRYNVGSEVVLFDGSGFEFDAVIESLNNRTATLDIVSKKNGILPKNKIVLCQSLIKKDKMEWIVEKATELGVSKIIPLIADRSEKKGFNLDRARKIAIEASEQCGRADVPEIFSSQHLVDSIQESEGEVIVFDPSGIPFSNLTTNHSSITTIFIGPEGGWTEKEIEMLKQKGAQVYSLGSLILRAETAAIVALSKII